MTPLLPAFTGAPEFNRVYNLDALALLKAMPSESVDAIITDPPYPEIDRAYGRLSEFEWMVLMKQCVIEFRRILKPTGSAMLVLQANSEILGKMRLWLWEFMLWAGREWNIVQDVYWWNFAKAPTAHCNREFGLMRPSVKNCIWLGSPTCYRKQDEVLWYPSESMQAESIEDRALYYTSSGTSMRRGRVAETVQERGGTTPFNLIPLSNANSTTSGGSFGHGAATPEKLIEWWVKYISPSGGVVLDPFMGSGTTALVARRLGRQFIGSELSAEYMQIIRDRLRLPFEAREVQKASRVDDLPLFKGSYVVQPATDGMSE